MNTRVNILICTICRQHHPGAVVATVAVHLRSGYSVSRRHLTRPRLRYYSLLLLLFLVRSFRVRRTHRPPPFVYCPRGYIVATVAADDDFRENVRRDYHRIVSV